MAPELSSKQPLDAKLFKDFPTERELLNLIMHTSITVWHDELPKKEIEHWLTNFKGEVYDIKYERLLALWLLSHFTYYNKEEVTHLCRVAYRDLLHRVLGETVSGVDLSELAANFFSKTTLIPCEQMSGSSSFVAYFFRHANELSIKLFAFSLQNVPPSSENLLIVDDVTLTGSTAGQLPRFLNAKANRDLFLGKRVYLVTLVASESAVQYLENTHNVTVVSAIILDERDKCFHEKSNTFASFPQMRKVARCFAEHYGRRTPLVAPLGYNNGEYAFGFFYNTPDNSLPIFWGQINGWIPIIKRFHKSYQAKKDYLGNERFV